MRLYITGAGGFVGKELCYFFSKQKKIKQIYALYLNKRPPKIKKIQWVKGDASKIKKIPNNIDILNINISAS